MKKQVFNIWMRALSGGRFRQTTGQLCRVNKKTRRPMGYCCLGVLAQKAVGEGVTPKPTISPEYSQKEYGSGKQYGVLPHEVQRWGRIKSDNARVDFSQGAWRRLPKALREKTQSYIGGPISAVHMNDDLGLTFKEIATVYKAVGYRRI